MRIRQHLTYANVGVTICLFLVLAGGAAYALSLPKNSVGSREIKKHSIRSVNLKKHKAVRGVDVVPNSLRGGQIAERTLNASAFAPLAGKVGRACNLSATTAPVNCVTTSIRLQSRSRLLVIATGGEHGASVPTHASCGIYVDGTAVGGGVAPGQEKVNTTSGAAQNGFALTFITSPSAPTVDGTLRAGPHVVALRCRKGIGSPTIDQPQISVLGIASG
jgi:hypothetical protein